MTKICIGQQNLGITINWPDLDSSEDYRRVPIPRTVLQAKFGFYGYVSDLLDGPKYVIDTLCFDACINSIPITINHIDEQYVVDTGPFKNFAADDTFYTLNTSNYSRRAKQIHTNIIPQAQYLNNVTNTEAQIKLKEEMKCIIASIQQTDITLKDLNQEQDKVREKLEEKKHAKEDQQAQMRDVQERIQKYEQQLRKLEQLNMELVEKRNRFEKDKVDINILKERVEEITDKEGSLIASQANYIEKAVELFEKRNKAAMLSHFMDIKNQTVRINAAAQNESLNNTHKAMLSANDQFLTAQRETKEYMEAIKTARNDLPEELREQFNDILRRWRVEGVQTTIGELKNHIAREEGKMKGIRNVNTDMISHYNQRKQNVSIMSIYSSRSLTI